MKQPAHLLRALLAPFFVLICLATLARPAYAEAGGWSRTLEVSQQLRQPGQHTHADRDKDQQGNHQKPQAALQPVTYGGGPVMAGTTALYAIFWEPTGKVSARYHALIERYFNDVGSSPLYRIARQYKQADGGFPVNAFLAGVWKDTSPYRANPLLDSDIQQEVTHAQRINDWHSSLHALFFVFTERNTNVCMDSTLSACTSNGYCAYHSDFGTNTLYALVPYVASFKCDSSIGPNHDDADQTIDGISHEQLEAATDPLGDGWVDADGNEIADKCVDIFGQLNAWSANVLWRDHPYRVQEEWDNQTDSCRLAPEVS